VLFTNARNLGFPTASFDIALCGFMGWDDCFDFVLNSPNQTKAEIRRVCEMVVFCMLFLGGTEDIVWMEEAMLRFYPTLLQDENTFSSDRLAWDMKSSRI
jgi:hypothetical protein